MYCSKGLGFIFSCILLFSTHHLLAFHGDHFTNPSSSYHIGDVAINCGSTGKYRAFDGREWIGDEGSELLSSFQPKGKSRSSTAADKSFSADPVPYKTSRISATPFHYKFQVSPGQKFIRLHFHPAPYHGFRNSEDFFTVKAGPFTLLHNFSASLAAEAFGVNFFVKEFCLNVEEYAELNITFSPSGSSKLRKMYAFVNGIEIISMPTGLYYSKDTDLGARIVGLHNRFIVIDNSTALELIERLNIGGSFILSVEDFGLFRRWNEDFNYLTDTRFYQVTHPVHRIVYTSLPAYLAPPKIYQTSWNMEPNVRVEELYTFRWKIPVDVGFGYLVRLHFCDFDSRMADGGKKEFSVLINDQIAETKIDVISWSGGSGVPVYSDYMVMMKGDREGGRRDILIALCSTNELVVGLINGMEIFKLSNPDNSLAAPNLVFPRRMSSSWEQKIHKLFTLSQGNFITTGTIILLVLVNAIVYNLRQIKEASVHEEKNVPSQPIDPSFCCFSLSEIISATENFSDACLIGRGGFGKVYKGSITGVSGDAAIKRLNASSKQGDREFRAEVEALSKFRHIHLVSLIGFCKEDTEMILVYEYMPCGTLADNIYRLARQGKDSVPLSWEQRLKICIGASRGLEYLHAGAENRYVIHRDVKDTNILLDENLVAKISDFGLSKLIELSESKSYISTRVKGTPGYIDPEYEAARKLTREADVYAFGVVLLVVLCGRPAVDRNPDGSQKFLTSIFSECITEGDFEAIVDPSLQGRISPRSLSEFVKSVENCLHHLPKNRATMAQVATSLELALELQERIVSPSEDVGDTRQPYEDGTMESMQFSQSPAPLMLEESIASFPPEGTTKKTIQSPTSSTKAKETQVREESLSARKSKWGWPWRTAWNRGKPTNKMDLVLSNGFSPSSSVDEQLYHIDPCISIEDIRAARDNSTDGFQTVARGRKACVGSMKQLPKPVIIYEFNFETHAHEASEIYVEIEKLSKLRHVNLHSLIGYSLSEPENQKFIVYEHVGFDSLDNHIYWRTKNPPLPWKRRLNICIGVANGLAYLQKCTGKTINHHDLRLEYILLDENWNPKISHFGQFMLNTLPAVQQLMRTDIHSGFEVRGDSDLCSLGLLLLEILFARRVNLEDCGKYLMSMKETIKSRKLHVTIDSTLDGEIAAECLAEYLKAIFYCFRLSPPTSLENTALKLKLALEFQERAEAKRQEDVEAKQGSDSSFSLEYIYQEISYLALFSL